MVYELVASELTAARQAYEEEVLSIEEAMVASGYTRAHLHELLREGKITLRRCDLPRRPGHGVAMAKLQVEGDGGRLVDLLAARRRAKGRR